MNNEIINQDTAKQFQEMCITKFGFADSRARHMSEVKNPPDMILITIPAMLARHIMYRINSDYKETSSTDKN